MAKYKYLIVLVGLLLLLSVDAPLQKPQQQLTEQETMERFKQTYEEYLKQQALIEISEFM